MFANPKAALGFAGVTIAIAIAASFAAGSFLPGADGQAEGQAVAATETEGTSGPAAAAPAAPAQQMAWSDDEFADDWNSSAVDSATGVAVDSAPSGTGQPTFSEYSPSETPQSAPSQSNIARSAAPTRTSGPRITSRTAPGVAPPRSPNAGEPGELLTAD